MPLRTWLTELYSDEKRLAALYGRLLVLYLLAVGGGATVCVILGFPETQKEGVLVFRWFDQAEQGLIVLAISAGVAGSFIHAAQSLSSYLGNNEFKTSWTSWYLLRPWIGGVLAFAIYFVFRAGLVAGATSFSPYGVVAIGLLGGWFSKTTADKLQEVFETLFKTDEDRKRKDSLGEIPRPEVKEVAPSPVPAGHNDLMLKGTGFLERAVVLIDEHEVPAEFASATELRVSLAGFAHRPAAGARAKIKVKNPQGAEPVSEPIEVDFS